MILKSRRTLSTLFSDNGLKGYSGLVFSEVVLGSSDFKVNVLVRFPGTYAV